MDELRRGTSQPPETFATALGYRGKSVRGEKPATLADLSEELAVSRERVRQLQREAEGALRDEGEYAQDLPAAA